MKRPAGLIGTVLTLLCWAGWPHQPLQAAEVILVRHGDKDLQRGDANLSPTGFLRAIALGQLIPACFGRPAGISTFFLDPDTSKNARSYQTAVPLGVATGVNIRIITDSPDRSAQFGRALRQAIEGTDSLQVLFWEHRHMPILAKGLGWDAMPAIPYEDFDQLIVLHYDKPGSAPRVERLSQRNLFRSACFTRALQSGPIRLDVTALLDGGTSAP